MRDAIRNLSDRQLSAAIEKALEASQESLAAVDDCFRMLTAQTWPRNKLLQFLHAWRDTHLTAVSVSAITCRLLVMAEQRPDKELNFNKAAGENAKIIHEDLGMLGGEMHSSLYQCLADKICGNNEWELSIYQNAEAYNFRKWLHTRRVLEPELETGLLTTIASEIYNHGEYTLAAPLFRQWMTRHLKIPAAQTKRALAYIVVHTGDTESKHFLHEVNALGYYWSAVDQPADYRKIRDYCIEYFERIGTVFTSIAHSLNADEHLPLFNRRTAKTR